jgi:hypothetical protein
VGTGFPTRSAQNIEHDPEKWIPVFRQDHAQNIEHDPEKWIPVFRQDHAQNIKGPQQRARECRYG